MVHGVVALAMLLEGPQTLEQVLIVTGNHPTLTSRSDDLVLTEGKRGKVTEAANHLSVEERPVGLGGIFNN